MSSGDGFGKDVILFGVCNSSFVHSDNRRSLVASDLHSVTKGSQFESRC